MTRHLKEFFFLLIEIAILFLVSILYFNFRFDDFLD